MPGRPIATNHRKASAILPAFSIPESATARHTVLTVMLMNISILRKMANIMSRKNIKEKRYADMRRKRDADT